MPATIEPVMTDHSDSLRVDKKRAGGSNVPRPMAVALSILIILLLGFAISRAGLYQTWPEAFQISAWFALPIIVAFWRIAASKKPMLRLRCPRRLAAILPKPHFLEQVRRERLRAGRCKAPVSLFVFSFDEENGGEATHPHAELFLERVQAGIRETDCLGHIGKGRFGLLLTDTDPDGREAYLKKLLAGLEHIPVAIAGSTYPDQFFNNFMAEHRDAAGSAPVFLDVATHRAGFGYPLKRSLDVVGALAGIVLFAPVLLLTAIAIKATSRGPVIFKQTRLGKNCVPFVFYKFRSMAWNADDRIHRDYVTSLITGNCLAINQGDAETPLYKIKADPRVTRVGRIIRKTSIDELPQLFNVLKGDMSLVGPRPPLPYEAERYESWHFWRIFEAQPGITGLWQVEGRSRTSFDDMVRLDLEYSRNCSLMLDLKILLRTVKVVLQGIGAA